MVSRKTKTLYATLRVRLECLKQRKTATRWVEWAAKHVKGCEAGQHVVEEFVQDSCSVERGRCEWIQEGLTRYHTIADGGYTRLQRSATLRSSGSRVRKVSYSARIRRRGMKCIIARMDRSQWPGTADLGR